MIEIIGLAFAIVGGLLLGYAVFAPRAVCTPQTLYYQLADIRCTPLQAHAGDAWDLRAYLSEPLKIRPGCTELVSTGLRLKLPLGYFAWVTPRSGRSLQGLLITNAPGRIDTNYRGEIGVILRNIGESTITIKPFERIAQLTISREENLTWRLAGREGLGDTDRGSNGFGSTGK